MKQRGIAVPYFSTNAKEISAAFKDPDGNWTGFSARARVLIVHKRLADKPDSILAYTDPRWKGRAVIANPLFGTTTAHVAALFLAWGEERARKFMNDLKGNGTKISTSNGESADLVAKGEVDFGLVDSDDAVNRMRQGKSIEMTCPDQATGQLGCLILPNAALLLKDAPHPREAKRLIDYLLSRETERKLAFADCAQIPLHPGVDTPSDVPKIKGDAHKLCGHSSNATRYPAIPQDLDGILSSANEYLEDDPRSDRNQRRPRPRLKGIRKTRRCARSVTQILGDAVGDAQGEGRRLLA